MLDTSAFERNLGKGRRVGECRRIAQKQSSKLVSLVVVFLQRRQNFAGSGT
jgi:hypothetical protein